MIKGKVNAANEVVIKLTVRGPTGRELRFDAMIDTGYNGWLTLPSSIIAELKLPWLERGYAVLADDSESYYDVHEGIVDWDHRPCSIPVDESESVILVGMALMENYELKVQVRRNGNVTLKPIPRRKSR